MKLDTALSIAALALSLGAVACSSHDDTPPATTIDSLVPAANEISGWAEDTAVGNPGVETGKTRAEVEARINGDVEPFAAKGFTAWARQHYVKGQYKLELRIWEVKDHATAESLYADLVANVSLYKALEWTNLSLGDAGRVANSGTTWWLNTRKHIWYIETRINQPMDADPTAKMEAEAFARAIVAKIP